MVIKTINVTKDDLIKSIEKTFKDTTGTIGVITETEFDTDDEVVISQTITLGLPLEY